MVENILSRRALGARLATIPLGAMGGTGPWQSALGQTPAPGPVLVLDANMAAGPARAAPGPGNATHDAVLRFPLGTTVRLTLRNAWREPVALVFSGLRGQAEGGPMPPALAPGAEAAIGFLARDAGTIFYRAADADAQRQGVYGVLIVDEADPPAVALDLPFVLAGTPAAPLVNGGTSPVRIDAAPGSRIRLRLVNGTPTEGFAVSLAGARPIVAAIDGQPCEAFEPLRGTLPIGPGARFDIFFDCPRAAGNAILLTTSTAEGEARPLCEIALRGDAREPLPPFAGLAPNPLLPAMIALEKARRFDIGLGGAVLPTRSSKQPADAPVTLRPGRAPANGQWGAPAFSVRRNSVVVLSFINRGGLPWSAHVQGQSGRLLHALDDGWDAHWRDSILIGDGRTARFAFVAEAGKWLIETAAIGAAGAPAGLWFDVT